MMEYGRDPTKFSLPKQEGIRQRVMKLGEETIEETKALFTISLFFILWDFYCAECLHVQASMSKISISLNAWTSSNYYAFLAIVAHYVTDDGYCSKIRDIFCGLLANAYLRGTSHQFS